MRAQEVQDPEPDVVRSQVLRSRESHPVLDRLRRSLVPSASPGDVIAKYDRMHHRHNRS